MCVCVCVCVHFECVCVCDFLCVLCVCVQFVTEKRIMKFTIIPRCSLYHKYFVVSYLTVKPNDASAGCSVIV